LFARNEKKGPPVQPDPSTMTDAEIRKMFHCAIVAIADSVVPLYRDNGARAFVTIAKAMDIIHIELRRIKAEAKG
jgi:hypothetical protein